MVLCNGACADFVEHCPSMSEAEQMIAKRQTCCPSISVHVANHFNICPSGSLRATALAGISAVATASSAQSRAEAKLHLIAVAGLQCDLPVAHIGGQVIGVNEQLPRISLRLCSSVSPVCSNHLALKKSI